MWLKYGHLLVFIEAEVLALAIDFETNSSTLFLNTNINCCLSGAKKQTKCVNIRTNAGLRAFSGN